MTTTNHMLTGAVISMAVGQPYLAIPLAILSHFVLDPLPHFGEVGVGKEGYFSRLKRTVIIVDALIAGVVLAWLLIHSHWLAAVCAIAAVSPDFIWIYREAVIRLKGSMKPRNAFSRFHERIQWGERSWGLIIEIVFAVGMLQVFRSLVS
mgnify:CR=1 FL=1